MNDVASFLPPTEEVAKPKKAKAKAKAKIKAAPKAKTEPSLRRSKFETLYPDDTKLAVLVADNPKKKGSKAREMFEGYRGATTVGEARANGVSYASIAYDIGRQFIKVG